MRTSTAIENIYDQAKIAYSYRLQLVEDNREHGLEEGTFNTFFKVGNIFSAWNVATTDEKDLFCDVLVREGYTLSATQTLFSEFIYNDQDYDRI